MVRQKGKHPLHCHLKTGTIEWMVSFSILHLLLPFPFHALSCTPGFVKHFHFGWVWTFFSILSGQTTSSCIAKQFVDGHEVISRKEQCTLKWFWASLGLHGSLSWASNLIQCLSYISAKWIKSNSKPPKTQNQWNGGVTLINRRKLSEGS